MVNSILIAVGLQPSLHDPCLFLGVPSSPTSPAAATDKSLHLGLYVDDFVYFSEDSAIKKRFERLIAAKLKVKFMGTVNWFLGTHFEWVPRNQLTVPMNSTWSFSASKRSKRFSMAEFSEK